MRRPRMTRMIASMMDCLLPGGTLCWKYDDGPPEVADGGHPDDIGPAWIERTGEPIEEVNDGE
jgi:hypothetical protein